MSHTEISFSKEVKEELLKNIPMARHCRIAEIAVIVSCAGKLSGDTLVVKSDNERITQKYFTLLKKTFNIIPDAFEEKGFFVVSVDKKEDVLTILQAVNILGSDSSYIYHKGIIASHLIKSSCCKRAFLKNAFVFFGTINSPSKSSHLEFVCDNEEYAKQIVKELAYFEIEAKIGLRKNKFHVVYLKDARQIGDFLRLIEANVATMEFENSLILREIANKTNRIVNCEVANSAKQINAAYKQLDDINYLNECIGLSNLPDTLRSVAEARLENPEVGLKELGELMKPPLGKSGVNHRLRKISEMAQQHREKNA